MRITVTSICIMATVTEEQIWHNHHGDSPWWYVKELGRPRNVLGGPWLSSSLEALCTMHHLTIHHFCSTLSIDCTASQYSVSSYTIAITFAIGIVKVYHCHAPLSTNVISCQYLTLDRVGIEPTTFQSADQASNHYTTGALMEMMVALRNITLIFKTEEPTGMKYLLETQKIKNMFIPVVSDLMDQQISQNFSTSYFVGSLKTLRSFDNLKDWANRNKMFTWDRKK